MKKKFSIKRNFSLSEACGKLFVDILFIFIIVVISTTIIATYLFFAYLLLDKTS